MAAVGDAPDVRPGIVHRLDRATSGVMLAARTAHAFGVLKELFQTRAIEKEYRALVHGVLHPAEGRIDRPIGIKPRTTKRSVFSSQMSKPAVTRYAVVTQIRVHFASLGHPVVGDTLYAPKRTEPHVSRLMLHAHRIAFSFDDVPYAFTAPLPAAFEETLALELPQV
jgi:23S rRNA pseudouridine1911/1915/1917 synthase